MLSGGQVFLRVSTARLWQVVALVVDYTFELAGAAPGDGLDLATFSRLCQTRDAVLRQCVPDCLEACPAHPCPQL